MNRRACISCLVLVGTLAFGLPASAHKLAKSAPTPTTQSTTASLDTPTFVQDIDPVAIDAVKVVDAFSAAIKAGKLDEASKLLDPQVLILESGSSERSRDEYLGEHAIADASFMQTAQQQLRYRRAQAEGDSAWVGTESRLRVMKAGKPIELLSTETMVLKRTTQGWSIVHIHWSSRPAPKDDVQTDPDK